MTALRKGLVIGATGMIGRPVTAERVAAGFEVTALVRNAARARLLPAAVQLRPGDVADAASLQAALSGQDAVYLNLSVRQTERETEFHFELQGLENVLAAARAAGVRRVLYLSSLVKDYAGFRWWVFELKKQAAELVRRSGLPYTNFHPSAFLETLVNTQLSGPCILGAGQARHPTHWVSGPDYARIRPAGNGCAAAARGHEPPVRGAGSRGVDHAGSRTRGSSVPRPAPVAGGLSAAGPG